MHGAMQKPHLAVFAVLYDDRCADRHFGPSAERRSDAALSADEFEVYYQPKSIHGRRTDHRKRSADQVEPS